MTADAPTADAPTAKPIAEERVFEIAYERACLVVPNLVARAVSGKIQDRGAGYYVVFCDREAGLQRELTLRLGRKGDGTRVVVRADTVLSSTPEVSDTPGVTSSRALPQLAVVQRTAALRLPTVAACASFIVFILTPIVAVAFGKAVTHVSVVIMAVALAAGLVSIGWLGHTWMKITAAAASPPAGADYARAILEAHARAQRETRERDVLVHKALRAVEDAVAGQTTSAHYRVAPQGRAIELAREDVEPESLSAP